MTMQMEDVIRQSGSASTSESVWLLEGQAESGGSTRYVTIHTSPFTIGRRSDLSLSLSHATVSNLHAEILEQDGLLSIRDMGSTNGTFVNGHRVAEVVPLKESDLLQFADVAFRVNRQTASLSNRTIQGTDVCDQALALVQLDHMMSQRAVIPVFQPIVVMNTGKVIGHEVLGRSSFVSLETPKAMFSAAAQLNLEVELSRMFRWEGIQASASVPELSHLFVNTHPKELEEPGLIESIQDVRMTNSTQPLTLEIHEAAITDPTKMRELGKALKDVNVSLAYDDFGAGQTRLVELVEARPDYLKFDIQLIRGIDHAAATRQQMLATLVRMVHELGVVPLAEGIETEGEAATCSQLGFELAQGYYYGRPEPISAKKTDLHFPGTD